MNIRENELGNTLCDHLKQQLLMQLSDELADHCIIVLDYSLWGIPIDKASSDWDEQGLSEKIDSVFTKLLNSGIIQG